MWNIYFILIVSTFVAVPLVKAEMVSYVDENGEMHYVNTDFAKVPEKYRHQLENEAVENSIPANPETTLPQTAPQPIQPLMGNQGAPVEILVSLNCPDCQKLEILLKAHKVSYLRYDIDTHPRGKELYEEIGGNLPITKIGEKIIYGVDIKSIVSTLKENKIKMGEKAKQKIYPAENPYATSQNPEDTGGNSSSGQTFDQPREEVPNQAPQQDEEGVRPHVINL